MERGTFLMLRKNCFVQSAHTWLCPQLHAWGHGCIQLHGGVKDIGLNEMLPRDPNITCISMLCFGTGNFQLPGQDHVNTVHPRAALQMFPSVTNILLRLL